MTMSRNPEKKGGKDGGGPRAATKKTVGKIGGFDAQEAALAPGKGEGGAKHGPAPLAKGEEGSKKDESAQTQKSKRVVGGYNKNPSRTDGLSFPAVKSTASRTVTYGASVTSLG